MDIQLAAPVKSALLVTPSILQGRQKGAEGTKKLRHFPHLTWILFRSICGGNLGIIIREIRGY